MDTSAEAMKLHKQVVERKDVGAMCSLGWMYECGRGVEKDKREAVSLYKQAAGLREARAMCSLGWMYESGRGLEKDEGEAVRLYKQAAELGHPHAMCNLGWMYYSGRGVERNEIEAVRLCKQAVDLRHAGAMCNLGWMYANRRSMEKDEIEAVKLYKHAAELGHKDAMCNLGWMYEGGRGVEKDEGEAVKLYKQAAQLGHAHAMFNLGMMYYSGRGTEKDEEKAARLYKQAVGLGYAYAMCNLGWMYESGRGIEKDEKEAVRLYKQAVELGDAHAMNNLGWAYEGGRGVGQDEEEAVRLYKQAVELGDAHSMCNLGWMYYKGKGTEKDEGEALRLQKQAVEHGYTRGMCSLAWTCARERGVFRERHSSSSIYKIEDGGSHPQCRTSGVRDEAHLPEVSKLKANHNDFHSSGNLSASVAVVSYSAQLPVSFLRETPEMIFAKEAKGLMAKYDSSPRTFGNYLSLLAQVLGRESELFVSEYNGCRGPEGATFLDFEQLLQVHGAAVYGKDGHGLHKRPIMKENDSKLTFGISTQSSTTSTALGRGNLELLIRPTSLSLGGMTLASLMLDSMEKPKAIVKWLASQVKKGNCLTEKLSGKNCGRHGPAIISLRLLNRCSIIEDMLDHMEVLGAFAKVSNKGKVTTVSESNAHHRSGTFLERFRRRRGNDRIASNEHVFHSYESNDQMKSIGDTHLMRLNNKHRIIIVHQNSREWILTEMSGGIEVLGSGGSFGIARTQNPQCEEVLRSNDGIPLIDLNHLKTYKILSNGNPVTFPTKIKLMSELLGACGLRLIAKNDGFYYSIYSQNTTLRAVQATQKNDASIELNGSQDEGIEMRVTHDRQKLYMRALHDKDGEFNIVGAYKDDIIVRQKKKMRSFKVVGSISPEEAAIQNELRKLDKRCCVAITGDVVIEDFVDVIIEDFADEKSCTRASPHVYDAVAVRELIGDSNKRRQIPLPKSRSEGRSQI